MQRKERKKAEMSNTEIEISRKVITRLVNFEKYLTVEHTKKKIQE